MATSPQCEGCRREWLDQVLGRHQEALGVIAPVLGLSHLAKEVETAQKELGRILSEPIRLVRCTHGDGS